MFLVVFSLTEHKKLQIKIKNNEVLSVSVRCWNKKYFEFYIFRKFL